MEITPFSNQHGGGLFQFHDYTSSETFTELTKPVKRHHCYSSNFFRP